MSALFAAYADFEVAFGLPAPFDGHFHQLADAFDIEDLEGVVVQEFRLVVHGQKFILCVFTGK